LEFVVSLIGALIPFISIIFAEDDNRLSIPSAHDKGRMKTFDP
jgi:hypothetical protein